MSKNNDYESQFSNYDDLDQGFDLNSLAGKNGKSHSAAGKKNTKKKVDSSSRKGVKKDEWDISSMSDTAKRKDRKNKKKKSGPLAKVGRAILALFLVCVITGSLVVGAFAVYVFGYVDDEVDFDLNELKMNFTTTVYVKNGVSGEYEEYQRLHGEENRIWIPISEIPQDLVNAYIAVEDERFLTHGGVDWRRTIGAFGNLIFKYWSSNQGGSTITQQLIKNLTGDNDQSPMRKVREIMRARYVESNYSKETIVECYLNTIALANGINGVEVASNYYFGKSASDLSLAECATLAAMAKEPEYYRPDQHPDNNKERRLLVLGLMYDQELISSSEYEEAKNEEVVITANSSDMKEIEINNWFIDTLIDEVVDDLVEEYGYDETAASMKIYTGGYKIYCTMDPAIQATLEEVYKDSDNFARCYSSKEPDSLVQSAMTVMDYEGHIVGTVGGRGEKTENRGLNRALVPRQPGSTMKPIAVYAPAIESNLLTYGSRVKDEPIRTMIGGTMQTWPRNASGYYGGDTTAASALERSLNTVPVRVLQDLTLENSYDFLTTKLGVTSLDETQDMVLGSLALGGCYKGISPVEMTAAFATFGNLGRYYEPTTYTKILDQYDEIVLEQKNPTIAMGEDTANIMNRMLQNVIYGSSGTGTAAKFGNMPLFGKTGTTSDNNDRWFIGGSPYYVAACWFGFDTPDYINAGGNPALNVWRTAMSKIHSDLSYKDFQESSAVSYIRYCASSGMAATENCSALYRGWYKDSYMPACTTHGGSALMPLDKPTGIASSSGGYYNSNDDDDDDEDEDVTSSTVSDNSSSTASGDTSSDTSGEELDTPSEGEGGSSEGDTSSDGEGDTTEPVESGAPSDEAEE